MCSEFSVILMLGLSNDPLFGVSQHAQHSSKTKKCTKKYTSWDPEFLQCNRTNRTLGKHESYTNYRSCGFYMNFTYLYTLLTYKT